jgi:hypothetical protein
VTCRVALLDDYQDVARTLGPWDDLAGAIELTAFVVEDVAAFLAGSPVRVVEP